MTVITHPGHVKAANMRMNRHMFIAALINLEYINNIRVFCMNILLSDTLDFF